ncbi:MAG: FadR/GntR family transcriptional regulator [Acidimicrobiales bacterium]
MSPFRPVEAGGAFEKTVEQVLHAIRSGAVATGERLPPERELAIQLNVSRVTLREAIRALAEAGYVDSRRGRAGGTFVIYQAGSGWGRSKRSDVGHLEDLLAFRRIVEVGAASLAASRKLQGSEQELLSQAVIEAEQATFEEYRGADSRLHLLIAEFTGSALLVRAVADVRMRTNELLDALPTRQRPQLHSNAQHQEVAAAIFACDPTLAAHAMELHLEATAALLRGFLA